MMRKEEVDMESARAVNPLVNIDIPSSDQSFLVTSTTDLLPPV